MSDLEFLLSFHSSDEEVRAFVISVLKQGQQSADPQESHCDKGQAIPCPQY